jgi:SAM-dependent methyltransferase
MFVMTPDMMPYLLLQRTAYQRLLKANPSATPAALYHEEMAREFSDMTPFLPATAANVLDIGCGLAGIDHFVNRHYKGSATIHLLDKNGVSDQVYYLFHDQAAYYCSLEMARTFLIFNGASSDRVVLHDVSKKGFPRRIQYDLVLSLISWGFHYPISAYLKHVKRWLAPNGVVILDIRKGTGGEAELERSIGPVSVIQEYPKRLRVAARRDEATASDAESEG